MGIASQPCPDCKHPLSRHANQWRGRGFYFCWFCLRRWSRESLRVARAYQQRTLIKEEA